MNPRPWGGSWPKSSAGAASRAAPVLRACHTAPGAWGCGWGAGCFSRRVPPWGVRGCCSEPHFQAPGDGTGGGSYSGLFGGKRSRPGSSLGTVGRQAPAEGAGVGKGRRRGHLPRAHPGAPGALKHAALFFGPGSGVFYRKMCWGRGSFSPVTLAAMNASGQLPTAGGWQSRPRGRAAGFLGFRGRWASVPCGLALPPGLCVSSTVLAGGTPRGSADPGQEVCSAFPGVPLSLRFHPSLGML